MSEQVFDPEGNTLTKLLAKAENDASATNVPADATEEEKKRAKDERLAILHASQQTTNKAIKRVLGKAEDRDQQVSLVKQMRNELIQTGINKLRRGQFVLIIDGTSSMQPFMDNLKEIINDLIRNSFIKLFRKGFSMAICVYRDSPLKTETSLTFVFDGIESNPNARLANEEILDNINKFMDRNFVAKGGEDVPEWLNSGLYEGLYNTQWDEQAATKMVFVMTDAPNHGILNHGGVVDDTYPKGLTSNGKNDTDQDEISDLLREFRHNSMYLSFFKLLPDPGPGFKIMDQMLSAMYDNWLSIMREIDSNSLSRFSSYQIISSTTRSPEVMNVIRDSIMKTVFGSIEMSDANAPERSKKEMTSISATKLDLMLEAIDEGLLDDDGARRVCSDWNDDINSMPIHGGNGNLSCDINSMPLPKSRKPKGGHLRNIMKRSYKRSNKKK